MHSAGRQVLDDEVVLLAATMRWVTVLEEACMRLSPELRQRHPEVPWTAIGGMRNRIMHGYFDVDRDAVWDAVSVEVPELES